MHDARKMLPFLSYLFDPSNLDDHCRDEWLKQYDAPFVDNVISRAEAWRDDADAFLEILERQVEDANASRSPGRPIREVRVDGSTSSVRDAGPRLNGVTVPEPFALHPGRPKPKPPPEPIVRAPKPKPAPTTRTGPTAEQIALAKTFAANREATAAKYADPRLAFRLRAVERPSNLEHVRETMAAERAAEEAAKRAAVQGVCCDPAKRVTSKLLEPQIQLGVAYKSAQPEGSTYRISQCGNAAQVEALAKTGAARARKEESITAPFGQINWLNKTEPRRAYPIPKYLVRRSPESVRGRYDDASTSRRAFAPRPREEMKERAREAAKLRDGNKKKRAESFIPLGPRGIMDHPRHRMTTTTRAEYGDPVAFENAPEVKSHYASGGDGEGGER